MRDFYDKIYKTQNAHVLTRKQVHEKTKQQKATCLSNTEQSVILKLQELQLQKCSPIEHEIFEKCIQNLSNKFKYFNLNMNKFKINH